MEVTEQMAQVTQSKDKNVQLSLYSEQAGKLKIIPPYMAQNFHRGMVHFRLRRCLTFCVRFLSILHLA